MLLSLILTVVFGFRVGLFSMFMFGVAMCIGYVYADIILGFDPAPYTFEDNDPGDVGRRYSF